MEDFKTAIQKFQSQERKKIKQEFKNELDTLTQKVEKLTKENAKLKRIHKKVSEASSDFCISLLNIVEAKEKKTDSPNLRRSLRNKQLPQKEDLVNFQSIKDRIKYLNHDPQIFSNQLPIIGKKMADYYRTSYNKEPSKRDEKINDKHTVPVCVYSKNDWEYMDYLIKTSLKLE